MSEKELVQLNLLERVSHEKRGVFWFLVAQNSDSFRRVVCDLFYTFGISYIRTPAFIGSWLAQVCIVYQILVH